MWPEDKGAASQRIAPSAIDRRSEYPMSGQCVHSIHESIFTHSHHDGTEVLPDLSGHGHLQVTSPSMRL